MAKRFRRTENDYGVENAGLTKRLTRATIEPKRGLFERLPFAYLILNVNCPFTACSRGVLGGQEGHAKLCKLAAGGRAPLITAWTGFHPASNRLSQRTDERLKTV